MMTEVILRDDDGKEIFRRQGREFMSQRFSPDPILISGPEEEEVPTYEVIYGFELAVHCIKKKRLGGPEFKV